MNGHVPFASPYITAAADSQEDGCDRLRNAIDVLEHRTGVNQRAIDNGTALADDAGPPDAIALELNGRPRKTLRSMTPSEKFAEAVAPTP